MRRELLHTPEGVRDIYNGECDKKQRIEQELHQTFLSFGYHTIQTPTFEFFDVFNREIGTIPSKDLYKFFDREGNTLVLRPDMTPSIARAAAMYFGEETMPIRLCYAGNIFINNNSYQGRLKESTQLGAELIGDALDRSRCRNPCDGSRMSEKGRLGKISDQYRSCRIFKRTDGRSRTK